MSANRQPQIVVARMEVANPFASLDENEKLYAHHLSRAAWYGTRIILQQVSPEANDIFDLILEVHRSCEGDWSVYAATFLSNIGNFYGRGDQKFVPNVSRDILVKLASKSDIATKLLDKIDDALFSKPPFGLGFPSDSTQSQYYPKGSFKITEQQIQAVSKLMEVKRIWPENTRLLSAYDNDGNPVLEILQASVQKDEEPTIVETGLEIEPGTKYTVRLRRGDFAGPLAKICDELRQALPFAKSEKDRAILTKYIESFETGDLDAYRESQKQWVTDLTPRVENIFGFVEQYRDPAGLRSEFEALVAIENPEESRILKRLVDHSDTFIRRLPWARGNTLNNGKGPFEKSLFEPPSFASIHTLVYCSTILFDGINLPNYNDIRQSHGFKNVIIANRLAAGSNYDAFSALVEDDVQQKVSQHSAEIGYLWLVLHELLGHGTGQMMVQEDSHTFNFDSSSPPINPLTGKSIESWYKPGETWTGRFGGLATSVDECRCELVGAFLLGNPELLRLFGYSEDGGLKPQDLLYLFYVRFCALSLLDLNNYNPDSQRWGQAHSRAHFAMFTCLLRHGGGCVTVLHEPEKGILKVKVDRDLVLREGRKALEDMLLRLHMYRVTADFDACKPYFEDLSQVTQEHLSWRTTIGKLPIPRLIYVHANTLLKGNEVALKQYEESEMGIIQSWIDREV
ncbi:hypothetical protein LTR05_003065 [Lithohypha guttulata]|uniref:Dipeptidyl aminopeptidase III n=1 Tax=Lithohypha guttulata TaxID=1690604 RepID=A0AAN7Y866_9EURO|nr:hypothetical protein LTR05_003065 [Lithohypha guttulata]